MRRLAVVLLFVAGCGGTYDDNDSVVDRLRVLGVQADPPEIAPGETTTLSALVADPRGNGRTISYEWSLCTDYEASEDFELACDVDGNLLPLGTGETLEWTAPLDSLTIANPLQAPILLEVRAGGSKHYALKRVLVSDNPSPEGNPDIAYIAVDGVSDIAAGGDIPADWDGRATVVVDVNGLSAGLNVYVSAGALRGDSDATSDEDKVWKLEGSSPDEATIWAVARSGSAGVAWRTATVVFE